MTVTELRDFVYDLTADYFKGAVVSWGEQNNVKPPKTFVRLKLDGTKRGIQTIEKNGTNYLEAHETLTVELFTHGRREGTPPIYVNTATEDLMDYINYLMSEHVAYKCYMRNISIVPDGDIRDSSSVIDNDYAYRARTEIRIDYMTSYSGGAGISRPNWKPTASGGGTEELADESVSDIDRERIEMCKTIKEA